MPPDVAGHEGSTVLVGLVRVVQGYSRTDGRIFKTLHLLPFVPDEGRRRMIGAQLCVTEARHRLARKMFLGRHAFTRPAAPGLRPLRDPHEHVDSDDGEAG
ncbi:Tn3 family transposase [Streptomyces sp. NPDC058464]|uniref:Tn3 family transposase n=1 Tax=Streptomyces sp. NPDC058464 TaxID=3346511 RepID=UPI00364DF467